MSGVYCHWFLRVRVSLSKSVESRSVSQPISNKMGPKKRHKSASGFRVVKRNFQGKEKHFKMKLV